MNPAVIHSPRELVSEDAWEQRKAFVGFGPAHEEILRELRPVALYYADEVMDELYARWLHFPELRRFFTDDSVLGRVKALQRRTGDASPISSLSSLTIQNRESFARTLSVVQAGQRPERQLSKEDAMQTAHLTIHGMNLDVSPRSAQSQSALSVLGGVSDASVSIEDKEARRKVRPAQSAPKAV